MEDGLSFFQRAAFEKSAAFWFSELDDAMLRVYMEFKRQSSQVKK
jgi:hypothetical protein